MLNAVIIIDQAGHPPREAEVSGDVMSIGRALDNTVCFDGDTNVSRYHAVIETRGDEFWLSDLGSVNGTTINGEPVEIERQLQPGDFISVGGESTIQFHIRSSSETTGQIVTDPSSLPFSINGAAAIATKQRQPPAQQSVSLDPKHIVAGIGIAVVLTVLLALLLSGYFSPRCRAAARIASPPPGTTVREPTIVRVSIEEARCVERVIYQINGIKFGSVETEPFDVTFDPAAIPELADGNHILSVTVEDKEGKQTPQPDTVLVGVKMKNEEGDAPTAEPAQAEPPSVVESRRASDASPTPGAFEVREMCVALTKRLAGTSDYDFSSKFIEEVRTHAEDYLIEGYYVRAHRFREAINSAFSGQGVEPLLGYVMAMSRSKFDSGFNPTTSQSASGEDRGQGLWRMPPSLIEGMGYAGPCPQPKTLTEKDQKCASVVAAAYMKDTVHDLFRNDFVFAVAFFGLKPSEAAELRDQLPPQPERRDFWKMLKSKEQRERVVRFFAAGIVGENPEKFGLSEDKPLSNLYRRGDG